MLHVSAPELRAQDRSAAVLLIDSSSRMAGKLDGIRALRATSNALVKKLANHDRQFDLGIVAFGGKGEGCNTSSIVTPIGPISAESIGKQVGGLRPMAHASLALGIKTAVEHALNSGHQPAILLMSAGGDRCKQNSCKIASTLKEHDRRVTVHVVALGKGGQRAKKELQCIARETHGQFGMAKTTAEIAAALDPVLAAVAAPLSVRAQGIAQTPQIKPSHEETASTAAGWTSEATVEAGKDQTLVIERTSPQSDANTDSDAPVHFAALLTENGRPITSGLTWRVYTAKRSSTGSYKLLKTSTKPAPVINLSPGDYLVNAAYGRAHLTKRISVQPDTPLEEQFILNAGGLRLRAVWPNGGKLPDQNVTFDILSDEKDQFGSRQVIMKNARAGLIVRLNAGLYHIISSYGDANARVEADVTVEAGKLTDIKVNHGGARATFKLVLQPGGGALADTHWRIEDENGQVIKRSAGALPTHILAAGRYTVFALRGSQNFTQRFQLTAGEIRQIEVVAR